MHAYQLVFILAVVTSYTTFGCGSVTSVTGQSLVLTTQYLVI
jgi:hypothetical protein